MKMRRLVLLALPLVLALSLPACGNDEESGEEGGGELQKVVFALTNQRAIQYNPFYIADYLGYYEDEGLEVEIQIFDGSSTTVQQIIAGNVDIGLPSGPATAQAISQGHCLKQFMSFAYQNVFGLAAPADSGITSLEDLRGKTIGISEPGGGEIPLVRAMMTWAGLQEGTDYEMVPIGEGGALTLEALQKGRADAYSSSVYDIASVEVAGMPLEDVTPEEFLYTPSNAAVATCDVYENEQDMLIGFGRAVAKAAVFAEANRDAAWDIIKTYEPELFEDEALAESIWEVTDKLNEQPPAIAGEPFGTHHREGWETYLELASQGTEEEGALPPNSVDVDAVLASDLIDEINDFDRDAVEQEAQEFEGVS